jgi:DNA-binding NtrC family response regulator
MGLAIYPAAPLLLVDDEKAWLDSLAFTLEYEGGINHVLKCQDSREVPALLEQREFTMVLLDLTMPHLCGEKLLVRIVRDYPELPVIILSGMNQLETVVRCIQQGASDFFVKTMERQLLMASIRRNLAMAELKRENEALKRDFQCCPLRHPLVFREIISHDCRMHALFRYVEGVAASNEPVLITGESGVGKELVARALHTIGRPGGPWVAVNAAGLDDQAFSDTLFGHSRGAYTGADSPRAGLIQKAEGGTLFLDEIGDLAQSSQIKLLRFLQEGEYYPLGNDTPKRANVRVVCATNHDLEAQQTAGIFRRDLYFRLGTHRMRIPPLRERREDLPLLLDHFLREAAAALGKRKPACPEELVQLLGSYHFPGNIRELRGMVHDAMGQHVAGKLSMQSFREAMGRIEQKSGAGSDRNEQEQPFARLQKLPSFVEAADLLVAEALRRAGGNQAVAAGMLGITRQALHKRLKKLD